MLWRPLGLSDLLHIYSQEQAQFKLISQHLQFYKWTISEWAWLTYTTSRRNQCMGCRSLKLLQSRNGRTTFRTRTTRMQSCQKLCELLIHGTLRYRTSLSLSCLILNARNYSKHACSAAIFYQLWSIQPCSRYPALLQKLVCKMSSGAIKVRICGQLLPT